MKRVLIILSVITLGLTNIQCSNDNDDVIARQDDTHTLWVNDMPFVIAANQPGASFNTTQFMTAPTNNTAKVRTFIMVNQMESVSDMKTITLAVSYPATQATINGTYPIMQTLSFDENSALISYMDSDGGFGGEEFNATGSVTITDNGNNNYKLVFNNVITQGVTSSGTKTITGYCQPTFAVINAPGKK
ncbi:hypothetical protein [Flavobacterium cerinum]|uniref:DUF4843 domain-containing protein n=1 Tax=Flavobacterium cerinum TaxID=2502784 RepID=A0ABY5IMF4_9FLAO|nr:hypothetical protein [Flavobacterium cerinum]UUC43929.1 hypothetical protein NOX80_09810 [Flavobacterium cerinum]